MRHKILTISLAAILALGPWVTALAADEQNSATVVNHGRWVGMSVSPNSWDIGIPEAESTYTDSFTLANTGNAPLDMYVKGNAATNGENIWTLDASGQYGESTYGLKYYISGEESKAALGSGLGALTEGLSGAHSQEFNLDLLTPTTAVDPNQPVSTSIDLYAIKNPESQDLSGDKENPIPYGEFAQYPSEISITGATAGEPVSFEDFYIRNDTDEEKTFYISTYAPQDDLCCEGYSRLSSNWVSFIIDRCKVDSVTVPANDKLKVQVRIAIPENLQLEGEQWECWLVVTTTDPEQEEPEEGINFNTYLCSRLLITAAGGSDESGGVGATTIIGAICGSALLVGFLGWRIRRRNSGSVIDSGDVDSDVDGGDDTSEAISGYAGTSYASSDDTDFSALADDPE